MATAKNHHDALIDMAVQDGWVRGHGWRSDLHRIGRARGYGELAELEESFSDALPRPDAWRIIEQPRLVILEFLEVEVTSGVTQQKDDWYRWLWDSFDATSYFHLRIWHMDRFGVVRPYITDSTHYPMVFGMNAGWRSGAMEDIDDE